MRTICKELNELGHYLENIYAKTSEEANSLLIY